MNFPARCHGVVLLLAGGLGLFPITRGVAEPGAEESLPEPATNAPAPADARADAVENAVVKVFSTVRYPDPYKPWTKQAPTEISGSGVVIEGKRILSNAHVVMYASQVQIQANHAGA